jgi:hypothetical protein
VRSSGANPPSVQCCSCTAAAGACRLSGSHSLVDYCVSVTLSAAAAGSTNTCHLLDLFVLCSLL